MLQGLGCQTTLVNTDVVKNSDVIFLAVKPHLICQVAKDIASFADYSKHLFVSVAAAITTDVIEKVIILFHRYNLLIVNLCIVIGQLFGCILLYSPTRFESST